MLLLFLLYFVLKHFVIQPGVLVEAFWFEIRCVNVGIYKYPVIQVEVVFRGKKHRIKSRVTDWPNYD